MIKRCLLFLLSRERESTIRYSGGGFYKLELNIRSVSIYIEALCKLEIEPYFPFQNNNEYKYHTTMSYKIYNKYSLKEGAKKRERKKNTVEMTREHETCNKNADRVFFTRPLII